MRYIDLTDKTENQITVDREDGIYLGHSTTVLLDDGRTIYTVYPKGHGVGQLVMKRSDDAGLTWKMCIRDRDWAVKFTDETIGHRVNINNPKQFVNDNFCLLYTSCNSRSLAARG